MENESHTPETPTWAIFNQNQFHAFSTGTPQERFDACTPEYTWVQLSPSQIARLASLTDGDNYINAHAKLIFRHGCRIYAN